MAHDRPPKTFRAVLAAALLAVICLVAAGGVSHDAYRGLRGVPSVYRGAALDGADSTDYSSPISTTGANPSIKATNGNPSITVSPALSVSGATATIKVLLYQLEGGSYTFLGVSSITTATGGDDTDANGEYPAQMIFADSGLGATHYEIRKTDPSDSATIRMRTWAGGSRSE